MERNQRTVSLGQKWTHARPTKTVVFWCVVASSIVTMLVGFTWGGWVLGGTARSMAEAPFTSSPFFVPGMSPGLPAGG